MPLVWPNLMGWGTYSQSPSQTPLHALAPCASRSSVTLYAVTRCTVTARLSFVPPNVKVLSRTPIARLMAFSAAMLSTFSFSNVNAR